jgi:membrane protein implicated in regulation of membrane protease activity
MAERRDVEQAIAACERYWRETGVPRQTAAEMRMELEQHLLQATDDGRTVEDVIGADRGAFAEAWAAEWRQDDPNGGAPPAPRPQAGRWAFWAYLIGGVALVAGVVVGATLGNENGGGTVDNEIWRWFWTGLALLLGIGEIFTAGFFLLPFGIGAAAAAVLAWLGVNLVAQWLVFFAVSILSLAYLRRYIRNQDEVEQPRVGPNRLVGLAGMVLETIDATLDTGLVRVGGEEWRALAGETIEAGTWVVVEEVRGTRVMVAPRD